MKNFMNIHLLRSHIEKIVPLSDEEFALVASYFVERSLKKTPVFGAGERADSL